MLCYEGEAVATAMRKVWAGEVEFIVQRKYSWTCSYLVVDFQREGLGGSLGVGFDFVDLWRWLSRLTVIEATRCHFEKDEFT